MSVLHNMASDAARYRLASPRLTNFDSVALSCTRLRRVASPRLAYVWMPIKSGLLQGPESD